MHKGSSWEQEFIEWMKKKRPETFKNLVVDFEADYKRRSVVLSGKAITPKELAKNAIRLFKRRRTEK